MINLSSSEHNFQSLNPIIQLHTLITQKSHPNSHQFFLVEPNDVDRSLIEFWRDGDWGLNEIPYQSITKQNGFFLASYFIDTTELIFMIPDENWLNTDIRFFLENNLKH